LEETLATEYTQRLDRDLVGLLSVERFEPSAEFVANATLNDPSVYEEADRDWQGWWASQAKKLDWFEPWNQVLDDSNPPFYKWFLGGKLNVSYNCVDRHVLCGNGGRVAYHWRGEEGEERDITYQDLYRDVQKFASALKDLGIEKGDVVGIYAGMIPETVISMLACVLCITSCSAGFPRSRCVSAWSSQRRRL
jgi:acetyl-CoA synthetase